MVGNKRIVMTIKKAIRCVIKNEPFDTERQANIAYNIILFLQFLGLLCGAGLIIWLVQ